MNDQTYCIMYATYVRVRVHVFIDKYLQTVVVFMDEAGLPEESHESLKV